MASLLDNILSFGATPPQYLGSLLGDQQVQDLKNKALTTGAFNALVGYLATPKNRGLGLGTILGNTLMAGQQGAQGVYDQAIEDYQTQAKIAEMQRKARQERELESMISEIQDPNQRIAARIAPQKYAESLFNPTKRETFVAPDGSIRFKVGGEVAQTGVNVSAPQKRNTVTVGNVVIDVDTGETIYAGEKPIKTQEVGGVLYDITDPTKPKIILNNQTPKKLYSDTPIETDQGLVYMPTAEGVIAGKKPINSSGVIVDASISKSSKPTDQQLLAGGFLDRMKNSNTIFNSQVSDGKGGLTTLESIAGSPNFIDSPMFNDANRQQYRQAQEDWVRAKLRKESGAVIGDDEMEREITTYFPTYWDKPQTIAQKAYARRVAENAMAKAAGQKVDPIKPFSKVFTMDGKKIPATLGKDNNYYYQDSKTGKLFRVVEEN